jgi:hypothetical protein
MLSLLYQAALNSISGRQEYVLEKKVTGFSQDAVSEEARQYDAAQVPASAVALDIQSAAAATPGDCAPPSYTPAAPPAYDAAA